MKSGSKRASPRHGGRTRLMEAIGQRGRRANNIYLVYSPKLGRDLILTSDLEEEHWLLLESDSSIETFDPDPPEVVVQIGEDNLATKLDAVIRFRDGRREWREVKHASALRDQDTRAVAQEEAQRAAAARDGAAYRRITDEDLDRLAALTRNWRRVVAILARTRGIELSIERNRVGAMLRLRGCICLDDAVQGATPERRALTAAALFSLVQAGAVTCDLDVAPLSRGTKFWLEVPS